MNPSGASRRAFSAVSRAARRASFSASAPSLSAISFFRRARAANLDAVFGSCRRSATRRHSLWAWTRPKGFPWSRVSRPLQRDWGDSGPGWLRIRSLRRRRLSTAPINYWCRAVARPRQLSLTKCGPYVTNVIDPSTLEVEVLPRTDGVAEVAPGVNSP